MSLTIATFNTNGIRARLPIVLDWLEQNSPDLLCLQETKVQDKDFPVEPLAGAGYRAEFLGQKSYNGVAMLSKAPLAKVQKGFPNGFSGDQARFIMAELDGVTVINTYVPQGKEVSNPAFQYKLEFYSQVGALIRESFDPGRQVLWLGDLNVAPDRLDVHDPDKLYGHVCFHPDEHKALAKVMDWGLTDLFRLRHPEEKQFTFWDYRVPNGLKRNIGWRIDHQMATNALAGRCTDCFVDQGPRALPKPSDHTFLVARFE